MYINRNYEKNYYLESASDKSRIFEVINLMPSFVVKNVGNMHNIDFYYDTDDNLLSDFNASIRCRKFEDKQILSIKYSTKEIGKNGKEIVDKEFETTLEHTEDFLQDKMAMLFLEQKLREIYSFRIDVDILRKLSKLKPFLIIDSFRDYIDIMNNRGFTARAYVDEVIFRGKRKRNVDYILETQMTCTSAEGNISDYNRFLKELNKKVVLIPMTNTKFQDGLISLKIDKFSKLEKKKKDFEEE